MRKGFIFNYNKCVDCKACSAACIIENGWSVHPRNILTFNQEAELLLPVINLSLACNHCESAVCMKGCPASAFSRQSVTGAILIDNLRCIGCRYCQWNCPYDAPKFDSVSGTIVKCNLCYSGLIEGRQPACSSACPTGALRFGPLSAQNPDNVFSWFPDKKLNPAIEFTAKQNINSLKIIPEDIYGQRDQKTTSGEKYVSNETSLIIFSFLSIISVATIITSFIKGVFPQKKIFVPVLLLAGIVSFFHLGRKLRSWRSVANIRNSPLSREIAALIVYSFISLLAVFFFIPGFIVASSIIGLIFLLLLDSVYTYTNRSKTVILHSGQTFISALLIVSFFSGIVLPFIFIALIKLVLSVYNLSDEKRNGIYFSLKFLRIAFLVVSGTGMILHNSNNDILTASLFLSGELLDRIIFYIDFKPLNINTLITEQLNIKRDEKKGG
jgi:Fe-S-cluster-containing dehydrogenase component/DMSO reductase anchor subunit